MILPLDPGGTVALARIERSGITESVHSGASVVVTAEGSPLLELGDVHAGILPRSALKPLQSLAVLRTGVELTAEQVALSTASHAGTRRHLDVVRSTLAGAGLDESALQCPADWPLDQQARDERIIAGLGKAPIAMNCSGKHAAFLAASVHKGWPIADYLRPASTLQMAVTATVEELSGEHISRSATDGCGAPVPLMSLIGLARAIARIASSRDCVEQHIMASVLAHGWAIDGPGRPNAITIDRLGILAKVGAEGVMVMATTDGVAVAVKMLDGSTRASTLVALTLLARCGAVDADAAAAVIEETTEKIFGAGKAVGVIAPSSAVSG